MTCPSSPKVDFTEPSDNFIVATELTDQKINKDPLDTTRLDEIILSQHPARLAESEVKSSGGPVSKSHSWRTVGIRLALAAPVAASLTVIVTTSPPLGLKIDPSAAMEMILGLDRAKVGPDRLVNDATGSTALKSLAAPAASPAAPHHEGVYDGP
jgi:hypothetical protein